jgi:hypothetical protein
MKPKRALVAIFISLLLILIATGCDDGYHHTGQMVKMPIGLTEHFGGSTFSYSGLSQDGNFNIDLTMDGKGIVFDGADGDIIKFDGADGDIIKTDDGHQLMLKHHDDTLLTWEVVIDKN